MAFGRSWWRAAPHSTRVAASAPDGGAAPHCQNGKRREKISRLGASKGAGCSWGDTSSNRSRSGLVRPSVCPLMAAVSDWSGGEEKVAQACATPAALSVFHSDSPPLCASFLTVIIARHGSNVPPTFEWSRRQVGWPLGRRARLGPRANGPPCIFSYARHLSCWSGRCSIPPPVAVTAANFAPPA